MEFYLDYCSSLLTDLVVFLPPVLLFLFGQPLLGTEHWFSDANLLMLYPSWKCLQWFLKSLRSSPDTLSCCVRYFRIWTFLNFWAYLLSFHVLRGFLFGLGHFSLVSPPIGTLPQFVSLIPFHPTSWPGLDLPLTPPCRYLPQRLSHGIVLFLYFSPLLAQDIFQGWVGDLYF